MCFARRAPRTTLVLFKTARGLGHRAHRCTRGGEATSVPPARPRALDALRRARADCRDDSRSSIRAGCRGAGTQARAPFTIQCDPTRKEARSNLHVNVPRKRMVSKRLITVNAQRVNGDARAWRGRLTVRVARRRSMLTHLAALDRIPHRCHPSTFFFRVGSSYRTRMDTRTAYLYYNK